MIIKRRSNPKEEVKLVKRLIGSDVEDPTLKKELHEKKNVKIKIKTPRGRPKTKKALHREKL